ncbi:universal stress protein [Streptomyces sp. NPDC001795]|uniref:universal stress protein n=1 Tax=Streptomyces sp. NPDC001795 TaxID=3154525 RepID=UPI00331E06F6
MPRTITAGLDGSPESLTAADWAAREALLRDVPLRLVHALRWQPYMYAPLGGIPQPALRPDAQGRWADHMLREVEAKIAHRHPGLRITVDRVCEEPVPALLSAAEEAELLVLGSRGLGGVAGFLVGSVALAVVAGSRRPVVLVRDGLRPGYEQLPVAFDSASGTTPFRDVVLGLDLAAPNDTVIGFAFDAASRRAAGLRVVHGWSPALSYDGNDSALNAELRAEPTRGMPAQALDPWRNKFPGVEVTEQAVIGSAGSHLSEASRDASLIVVGRRERRMPVGAAVGPVTQAVLHHAGAPVAVVPHD